MGDMADMIIEDGISSMTHWDDDGWGDDGWGDDDGTYAPSEVDAILSDCILVRESPLAWLIEHPSIKMKDHRDWFPKSRCKYDAEKKRLTVPGWLVIRKGLNTMQAMEVR